MKALRPFAVPLALLVAVAVVGLMVGPAAPPNSLDLGSAGSQGARALALYLGQSGWQVTDEVSDPYAVDPASGVLLLPPEARNQLDRTAAKRLAAWVQAGGRLVELGGDWTLPSQPTAGGGFVYAPPRRLDSSPGTAAMGAGDGSMAGVRQVVTASGARWYVLSGGPWRSALGNIDGSLVAVRNDTGRGEVVALADPSPLRNDYLRRADNLALALDVMGDGQRSRLAVYNIDSLAYMQRNLANQRAAGGTASLPLSWRLLPWGLALAAVLGFWRAGRRTGPVFPVEPPPARPGTEFLRAQAHAYRRARANGAVLRYVFDAFRRDLARRTGLPPQAPLPALAAAAPRLGVTPAELQYLLGRVERSLATPQSQHLLTEKQMLLLVRDLVVMQRRMRHARG